MAASQRWYAEIMQFVPVPELAFWARDGGPLTVGNGSGTIHLALFERPPQPCRSTIAFAVGVESFLEWRTHLEAALGTPVEVEDHSVSWSLYFADPDGNPFEITSYDHSALSRRLQAGG